MQYYQALLIVSQQTDVASTYSTRYGSESIESSNSAAKSFRPIY